jgi:glyoxylase-like metal-dependent hydrolase (beta-lactamase superfamily II)
MIRTAIIAAALSSLVAAPAAAQIVPGNFDVHWNPGSADCAAHPQPPIQVHAYNTHTYILRENPCVTAEAPFMYLLIGMGRALLIDSGAVADAKRAPLAETVLGLLPGPVDAKLPLLVVHTHRHMDHRAGDVQFTGRKNVRVVGYDLQSVKAFYGFTHWPQGLAQIELGNRTVDVFPTPGHNETEVSFYDRNTALFMSGDFLMPGRLLIDDWAADVASAKRTITFLKDRPVAGILGGHIEFDTANAPYTWGTSYHPNEHGLALGKADLLALPAALATFNGFTTRTGSYLMINQTRMLLVYGIGALIVLALIVFFAIRWFVRRRRRAV